MEEGEEGESCCAASRREDAATAIASAWRDHAFEKRAAKVRAVHAATLKRAAEEQAERRRVRETELERFRLPGALARV